MSILLTVVLLCCIIKLCKTFFKCNTSCTIVYKLFEWISELTIVNWGLDLVSNSLLFYSILTVNIFLILNRKLFYFVLIYISNIIQDFIHLHCLVERLHFKLDNINAMVISGTYVSIYTSLVIFHSMHGTRSVFNRASANFPIPATQI